eukprot:g43507.t1
MVLEDQAPPRPPLPHMYSPDDEPPAVPPLPKDTTVIRHTSVRGLKRQSDERKRDREFGLYLNGDYKAELRTYMSEPELLSVGNGLNRSTAGAFGLDNGLQTLTGKGQALLHPEGVFEPLDIKDINGQGLHLLRWQAKGLWGGMGVKEEWTRVSLREQSLRKPDKGGDGNMCQVVANDPLDMDASGMVCEVKEDPIAV